MSYSDGVRDEKKELGNTVIRSYITCVATLLFKGGLRLFKIAYYKT